MAAFVRAAFADDTATKPRYISLAPSTTEVLFALGLDDEVVGVSSYCNYPVQAKNKEHVGTFSAPNMEKILALKPDYIFCTGLEQAPVISELRKMRLNVYVADPSGMEELFESIQNIGKITHKEIEAANIVGRMRQDIREVTEKVKPVPSENKPRVFIEIWHSPLTTAGKGSFVDELLHLAGGINIASDVKRPYSIFSPEEVIKRDPELIILAYMNDSNPKDLTASRPGWQNISAVRNGRVYNDINPDILLRPSPRLTEGLKEIRRKLYP